MLSPGQAACGLFTHLPKCRSMSDTEPSAQRPMEEMDILERRVSELIGLTEQLARENKALRTQQDNWSLERAKLIEKNELAKSRIESMIGRLRTLEKE
jgi:cell division protein ZapB